MAVRHGSGFLEQPAIVMRAQSAITRRDELRLVRSAQRDTVSRRLAIPRRRNRCWWSSTRESTRKAYRSRLGLRALTIDIDRQNTLHPRQDIIHGVTSRSD